MIVVSHAHKFVYVAVTKTACTTIKRTLGHVLFPEAGHVAPHSLPFEVMDKPDVASCRDYFRFAFVRNPWDRLLSSYTNKIVEGVAFRNVHQPGVRRNMPFDEFVELVAQTPDERTDIHWKSQHSFLAHEGRPIVDFVGRFEQLVPDWETIRGHVGPDVLPPLDFHLNPSDHAHYSTYYTPELVEHVRDRYRADAELYGYDFEQDPHSTPI